MLQPRRIFTAVALAAAFGIVLFGCSTPRRAPAHTSSEVPLSSFHIVSCQGSYDASGAYNLNGELRNVGDLAAGALVGVVVRDTSGRPIAEERFWPNGDKNLAPGAACQIEFPDVTEEPSATVIEARVIQTRRWPK